MARKNVHVVPRGESWAVVRDGADRASSLHETQRAAQEAARQTARREAVDVLTHGRDGKIRQTESYGNDPCPPKDCA
jgi:hypothetical protein